MPNPVIGNNGGPPLEPQGQMMDELAPFFLFAAELWL